jgi:prepilin-type N-terminal cleavage/methylation domain-containing protein
MVRYRMKNRWTLIETLIVVAIVGIVAAIAIPQFQNHNNPARVRCGECGRPY